MLWYVAIIGVINLGLGFFGGAYVRPCPRCAKARALGLSLLSPSSVAECDPAKSFASATTPVEAPTPDELIPSLITREQAEEMLNQVADGETKQTPLMVALLELAPIEFANVPSSAWISKRILSSVSRILQQSLAADHILARFNDQQFLLLAPHEGAEQATQRAEEMRQRVAATEFIAGECKYQTTVTCALAEATGGRNGSRLYEFLQESLAEAKRYGGNRTFLHDGNSPMPVVPAQIDISPQQLAI